MPPKKVKPPRYYIKNSEIKVKYLPVKGNSLVAVVDLPANSRLYYDGENIDEKQYQLRIKQSHDEKKLDYANYIMAAGKKNQYIDAHPRYGKYWPASRINEPAPKEKANMVIIYEKKDDSKVPVFVTIQPIKAGEELLCKYGDNYVRLYKVGQKAKKPAWL